MSSHRDEMRNAVPATANTAPDSSHCSDRSLCIAISLTEVFRAALCGEPIWHFFDSVHDTDHC